MAFAALASGDRRFPALLQAYESAKAHNVGAESPILTGPSGQPQ